MIFKLSNKVVQVYFQDKTKLMLCIRTKQDEYINKTNIIAVFFLATAIENWNKETLKRFKYMKEILARMLTPAAKKRKVTSLRVPVEIINLKL